MQRVQRGTGKPDLYIAPHLLNQMLLARDINGRRIYASVSELATALNVGNINTAEQFEGKTRTTATGNKKKKLLAIIANLRTILLVQLRAARLLTLQFDIDFNQEKSCLKPECLAHLLAFIQQSQSRKMSLQAL